LATGLQLARGLVDWQVLSAQLEKASRDLRLAAGMHRGAVRLRWTDSLPEGVEPAEWQQAMRVLTHALESLRDGLDMVSELAPDFQRLGDRTRELVQRVAIFSDVPNPEGVRWLEVSAQLRMVESPLDIANAFIKLTQSPVAATSGQDEQANDLPFTTSMDSAASAGQATGEGGGVGQKAWIFTSATLGDEPSLRWFTQPCGLTSARVMQVGSPFDYASQACLYVPEHFPKPGDPSHVQHVAQLVTEAVTALVGRTLVLTTTLNAMRSIGEHLQSRLDASSHIEVLVQGQSPKRRLMERFREGASEGRAGCILVASASFWEGFDVPGEALQLVVIDKLPFPPPGDPLFEARSQRITREGGSAFADHALPEAAVTLKQGAGRLIRSESDQGILVVCDSRLSSMSYGRRLVRGLPPMRRLSDHQAFLDAVAQLTKNATSSSIF
jgi:ATP-dependent DNA helicase DinG